MRNPVGGEGQAEDPGYSHSSVTGAQQTGSESEGLKSQYNLNLILSSFLEMCVCKNSNFSLKFYDIYAQMYHELRVVSTCHICINLSIFFVALAG